MPKRPPTTDRVPPTDEWGIYDPAKAGMQALFAKLGRPVIRASAKSLRQQRRRNFRPERTNDGVGLAIEEAMRRAGIMDAKGEVTAPPVAVSPARAVRMALKAAKPPKGMPSLDLTDVAVAPPAAPAVEAAPVVDAAPPVALKRKPARRVKTAAAPAEPAAAPAVADDSAPAAKPRAARKTAKARIKAEPAKHVAPAAHAAHVPHVPHAAHAAHAPHVPHAQHTEHTSHTPHAHTAHARSHTHTHAHVAVAAVATPVAAVAVAAAPSAPLPHVPPAPSPRRPRGPVPLAAWAHAVTDQPKADVRRADKRGFWRSLFRMPAEVALVEYARGCRIHRLLIETTDDLPALDLL